MLSQKAGNLNDADKRAQLLRKYKEAHAYSDVLPLVSTGRELSRKEPIEKTDTVSAHVSGTINQISTFKIRIFISCILFIGFLILGGRNQHIGAFSIQQIRERIGQTMDVSFLTNMFDFMEDFTYTDL